MGKVPINMSDQTYVKPLQKFVTLFSLSERLILNFSLKPIHNIKFIFEPKFCHLWFCIIIICIIEWLSHNPLYITYPWFSLNCKDVVQDRFISTFSWRNERNSSCYLYLVSTRKICCFNLYFFCMILIWPNLLLRPLLKLRRNDMYRELHSSWVLHWLGR
jgi:hypothetical protein